MVLEKTYDTVDKEALGNVLKIYSMAGRLPRGIKLFIERGKSMCEGGC